MYLCQHINIRTYQTYLYQPTLGTRFLLVHCCGPHFAPRSSSGTVTPTYGCQNWNWNIKAFFISSEGALYVILPYDYPAQRSATF